MIFALWRALFKESVLCIGPKKARVTAEIDVFAQSIVEVSV